MRPIKLKMSAFGSYKDLETIDFTGLFDKGIFLITGPTGAGKTTIFDGICYALYGRTSGTDKDENYIRNDMADEDILTYVELEFELRNKEYYIKRIPRQQRKKLRGDGYTEKPAEAELKLIDEGRILTNLSEVNEKVIELIGLECDQFRQIIMIPQGEFRRLITSKSKEREDILRKIFATEEFRKMQEISSRMTKDIKSDIDKLYERWKTNIASINSGDNEALDSLKSQEIVNLGQIDKVLKEQLKADDDTIKKLDKGISRIEGQVKAISSDINEGKHANALLDRKAQIFNEKTELENKKPDILTLQKTVERGRKALTVKPFEENLLSSTEKYKIKYNDLKETNKVLKKGKVELDQAEKELVDQKKRSGEADDLKQEMGKYKSLHDKVKTYDDKKESRHKLEINFKENKEKLESTKKLSETTRSKIKLLSDKKETLKGAESQYMMLEIRQRSIQELYKKLMGIVPLVNELEGLGKKLSKASLSYIKLEDTHTNLKHEVADTRKRFIQGYAGRLSQELRDGSPCPVCGSIHHPSPAHHIDGVATDDDLTVIEARLDKIDKELEKSRSQKEGLASDYRAKESLLEERKKDIEKDLLEYIEDAINGIKYAINFSSEGFKGLEGEELISFITECSSYIQSQIKIIKNKLTGLDSNIKEEKSISEEIQVLEGKKEKYEKDIDIISIIYTKVYADLESQTRLIEELERELPEDIRSEAGLNKKLLKLSKEVEKIEAAIKKAEENRQRCSQEYNSLISVKDEKANALEELKNECIGHRDKYRDQVLFQGFSDENAYKASKLSTDEIAMRDDKIRKFNEDLKSVDDRYKQIIDQAKGMARINIGDLEDSLSKKEEEREALIDGKTRVYSRLENNERIYKDLFKTHEEIVKKESEYKVIGDLSGAANGKNNFKVTFETYVLAAYFEQVIDAANARFRKMTKNRFQMKRVDEEGSGNAYKGLDIDVLDGNSGQFRPIKNISGGESFKASLSLALGLADVVQSHAGGIKLDTMFIDEGFGSLDSESLDDAINCLLELQSTGRLVGIISHVKELQERIHCGIEVTPTLSGSKTRYFY